MMTNVVESSISRGKATLDVGGMSCASCVSHVRKAAQSLPGVESCDVNLTLCSASVAFDPNRTNPSAIAQAISRSGYPTKPRDVAANAKESQTKRLESQSRQARAWFHRAVTGLVLWLPLEV